MMTTELWIVRTTRPDDYKAPQRYSHSISSGVRHLIYGFTKEKTIEIPYFTRKGAVNQNTMALNAGLDSEIIHCAIVELDEDNELLAS